MSYLQYNDQYRNLLKLGRLPIPYPFYYPYQSPAPNLSNETGCLSEYYGSLPYDCYFDNSCIVPDNLYYKKNEGTDAINDYYYYDNFPYQDPSSALGFTVQKLISNIPGFAIHLDVNLSNPWGIIIFNDIVWITNAGSGTITNYDLTGKPLLPIINVFGPLGNIAQPTGIAFNSDITAFPIIKGANRGSSSFIIVTRDGTINGYNPLVDPHNSLMLVDSSANDSVYTGVSVVNIVNNLNLRKQKRNSITITSNENSFVDDPTINDNIVINRNNIYIADFYNQRIDVFDGLLNRITTYPFIDEHTGDPIPEDYAPFNIVNIGDFLYVTYAKQNPDDNQYEFSGSGYGFISIFKYDGLFVRRFTSRGPLNAPWGIILAPSLFGYPAGSIMISNFGDGMINIFDSEGNYLSSLRDKSHNNIFLPGIRGLTINPNYARIIYWTSSNNGFDDSFVGSINTRRII